MFHKVNSVKPLEDFKLSVLFAEGITKTYDVNPLFKKWKVFNKLKENDLFKKVKVDLGGYGISWNEEIDLSCDELFENGKTITTTFDDLIALSDATILWQLSESTLRKAISYGKFEEGKDIKKYGKQWVISKKAMIREYGNPNDAK